MSRRAERPGGPDGPLSLITYTTLYPNALQPRHGIFVEQRLRHLVASSEVASRVVAPIPWFPLSVGKYGVYARVPPTERRHGLDVTHPRYPLLPKLGMTLAPVLLALATRGEVRRSMRTDGPVVAIDAHYFYPDGVAAVLLGRWTGRPVVVTARGTDVNLIPDHALARRQLLWAARRSAAMITVCRALKDRLVELGAPAERITVLRNGVDLETFRPEDPHASRARVGFSGPTLLSVGHLIERKGHHIAIEALARLPGVQLAIAGDGELEGRLRRLAQERGVAERVRFLGPISQGELRFFYSAAEALVLASSREGMANVLLEALACGTPVIATPTWGTPEVVSDAAAGVLMSARDPEALIAAYHDLVAHRPLREATRRFAERFSWQPTTAGQVEIFRGLGARRAQN